MPAQSQRNPPRRNVRRHSQDEITERRREVMRLRMRGMGYRLIAKKLGVGHMTVKRDLEVIREETGQQISQFQRDYKLAESIAVFEEVEHQAWEQFNLAVAGSAQKARFLEQVRSARQDQIKLLCDVGLIRKAPQEITHNVQATSRVLQAWSPAAQDLVALAIIKTGLTPGRDPVPDVIDAKAEVLGLPVLAGEAAQGSPGRSSSRRVPACAGPSAGLGQRAPDEESPDDEDQLLDQSLPTDSEDDEDDGPRRIPPDLAIELEVDEELP